MSSRSTSGEGSGPPPPTPSGARPAGSNPYRSDAPEVAPDLDAAAPMLRPGEMQRLNRKALAFLAAIVVLAVCAIVWLLGAARSDEGAPRPREQAVVIPELPRIAAPEPAPQVPAMAAQDATIPIPVLPPPAQAMPAPMLPAALQPGVEPSLLQRRIQDGSPTPSESVASSSPYLQAMMAGLPGSAEPAPAPPALEPGQRDGARFLARPDALLVRGSYIRCVLETRIVTDIPGFTSCVVTEPVYSFNGRSLLLPRGSKVLGRYESEPNGPRVAVIWDRITTPDGVDVGMDSPGVDGLGGAGHPGHYSAHWGSRIASALLISLISDAFAYAAAEEGPQTSTVGAGGVVVRSPFESITARSMERLANQALAVRRPPTVTISQGTVVNVYVARDVDFSDVLEQAR